MTKVFVYGTLKKGFVNHYLLEGSNFLGKGTARGFILINLGAFPGMVPGKVEFHSHSNDAVGEIYEVDDTIIPYLDRLEGEGNFYTRATIDVEIGTHVHKCLTYLFMATIDESVVVAGGDWS